MKRELLDENLAPVPSVTQAAPTLDPHRTRKHAHRKLKRIVKKEETPEAPPLPMSSPSLQWSSPMLPSSSPPRTPTHIAGLGQAWVYDDALLSPSRAYTSAGDSFLRSKPLDAESTKLETVKDENAQEAFWLSSFTCRTLPRDFSLSGNMQRAQLIGREPVSAVSGTADTPCLSYTRASGSATSAVQLGISDDAFDTRPTAHGASAAPRGNVSYRSSVVSPRASSRGSLLLADEPHCRTATAPS